MSYFVNDTLQKKIQRGEVNYTIASEVEANFAPTDTFKFSIETSSKQCYASIDIQVNVTTLVSLYEGISSATSSVSSTIYNMNRSMAASVTTTVDKLSTFAIGGSEEVIWGGFVDKEDFPRLSPLNLEAGLLLKPNTIYVYSIGNFGNAPSMIAANIFLREI